MYKNKFINLLVLALIVILSIYCTFFLVINSNLIVEGYKLIFLLPLSYLLCYTIFIYPILRKYGFSVFLLVFIVVSFVRYVVLSYLVVEAQWYTGRSYSSPVPDSFETAILLMCYELVVYCAAIYFFHNKLIEKKDLLNKKVTLPRQTFIYIVFIAMVLVLLLLRPSALNYFSFFSVNENIISISNVDSLTSVIAIFINVAKLLLVFLLISFVIKVFGDKAKVFSFMIVVTIITLNILIYFGANRSDFIFNGIASLLLLIYIYKRAGIAVSVILASLLPIIISAITSHRESVTITGGHNRLIDFTDTLQIYLAGIYNVAIGVEITEQTNFINPLLVFPDILRSAIGPNVILGNFDILRSSILFNERIFSSGLVSQIIPMISQGHFYLGFLFSPLIGVGFIFIAVYFTKVILRSRRIEIIFIFSLFSGRLGFVMAQNGNILINELTFFLPVFLLIYYVNNKIALRSKL